MFRLLFRQLHTLKIPESQLLFPVSKVTLETKDELWDDEILKKKHKYQITDLDHSKALVPEINQIR